MNHVIRQLNEQYAPEHNLYVRALWDGSMRREHFVRTQAQFYFAVVHFARPMAVLMSRLPDADHRRKVLANVSEEHGAGNPAVAHAQTFLQLLEKLDVPQDVCHGPHRGPAVHAFNAALDGVSAAADTHVGLACFGMIEDLFGRYSSALGRGIIARGWLQADEVPHYATHEVLDEQHAEDFYSILRANQRNDAAQLAEIEQGLRLGAHLLGSLYVDFLGL